MNDVLNSPLEKIREGLGYNPAYQGDIGIEIECEGICATFDNQIWKSVNEPSLRSGVEYVTRRPVEFKGLSKALTNWKNNTKNSKFKNSIRTSIHVHINVSDLTVKQMYNILGAYWFLENVLVQVNGHERVGNLHCLRIKDADDLFFSVLNSVRSRNYLQNFDQQSCKYAAVNLFSPVNLGSLEFRFLKRYEDIKEIQLWCENLYYLCHNAKNYEPDEIVSWIDELTTEEFLERFFSKEFVYYLIDRLGRKVIKDLCVENYCYPLRLSNSFEKQNFRSFNFGSEDLGNENNGGFDVGPWSPSKKKIKPMWILQDEVIENLEFAAVPEMDIGENNG